MREIDHGGFGRISPDNGLGGEIATNTLVKVVEGPDGHTRLRNYNVQVSSGVQYTAGGQIDYTWNTRKIVLTTNKERNFVKAMGLPIRANTVSLKSEEELDTLNESLRAAGFRCESDNRPLV